MVKKIVHFIISCEKELESGVYDSIALKLVDMKIQGVAFKESFSCINQNTLQIDAAVNENFNLESIKNEILMVKHVNDITMEL